MNKKIIFSGLFVVAALAAGYLLLKNKTVQKTDEANTPVKIGVIASMSGNQSVYGDAIREGVTLASESFSAGKKIEVIFEDDQGQAASAASAAQKLISVDRVKALITGLSPLTLAVAPIAEKEKVVQFAAISQASALTRAGDYIFRVLPTYEKQGATMADFAFKKGYRRAALIYNSSNDSQIDGKNSFKKQFEAQGGTVTSEEGYGKESTDLRTELSKISKSGADLVVLFSLVKDAGLFLKQKQELGIKLPVLSAAGVEDPQVIAIAGKEAAEGVIFATANLEPSAEFTARYEKRFGHKPIRYSLESYDEMMLLKQAIDACQEPTSDCIKDRLYQVKDYDGVSGKIGFDANGDVVKPIFLKIIKDGKFLRYEEN